MMEEKDPGQLCNLGQSAPGRCCCPGEVIDLGMEVKQGRALLAGHASCAPSRSRTPDPPPATQGVAVYWGLPGDPAPPRTYCATKYLHIAALPYANTHFGKTGGNRWPTLGYRGAPEVAIQVGKSSQKPQHPRCKAVNRALITSMPLPHSLNGTVRHLTGGRCLPAFAGA